MTIQEAIKSGKRYRRKGEEYWINRNVTGFPIADILADDWEIEREPREIWVAAFQSGSYFTHVFNDKEKCQQYCNEFTDTAKPVKFREVIE